MPTRKVAVAIGVGAAERLAALPGAVNGARAFGAWAQQLGYEPVVITDEEDLVTIERLREAFEGKLVGPPIHRMVIYFGGHGLIRNAEERLWLLSDWFTEQRAVAAEVLRRRLYYYGVEQLAIFADSCSALPPNMDSGDLTLDPILGRGPVPMNEPALDKFWAQPDGYVTYMVKGHDPEDDRCVFTGVLMEGLWGAAAEAFSDQSPNCVTSQSLAKYLKKEVPARATKYNFSLLSPSISPTFPPGDDIYFSKDPAITPPVLPPWPSVAEVDGQLTQGMMDSLPSLGPRLGTVLRGVPGFELERATADFELTGSDVEATGPSPEEVKALASAAFLDRLRTQSRPTHYETDAGFAIDGKSVRDLWTSAGVFAERDGADGWWRLGSKAGYRLSAPAPVLIEFEDGTFAAATAVPRFIGALLCDASGGSGLIYRPIGFPNTETIGSEKAIAAMESGGLNAEDVVDHAVDIRQAKHEDLTLGVIAAYLYDSIGDVDSIRRMASFYVGRQQPIPYDIAMLGGLRGFLQNRRLFVSVPAVSVREPRTDKERQHAWAYQATPSIQSGEVAGFWPWLRQGWPFLDDPTSDWSSLVAPGLIEQTRNLSRARFASLNREGGLALAKIFELAAMKSRSGGAAGNAGG